MGRWLDRLRTAEKNAETPLRRTDKTDKTPIEEVLSVLSVPDRAEIENFVEGYEALRLEARHGHNTKGSGQVVHSFAEAFARAEVRPASPEPDRCQTALHPEAPASPDPASSWRTRVPVAGPGITISPAAVELPPAEYDAALDRLIADAGADEVRAARLRRAKVRGYVVNVDGRSVFTRGRWA